MDRDAAIEHHRGALMSFARLTGSGADDSSVIERDGVVASLAPGVPNRSIVNSVAYRDAEALAAALDDLAGAYDEARVTAWTVWVPEDDGDAIAILEAAGHRLDASPVAMMADLHALAEPDDEGLDWSEGAEPRVVARINDHAYGVPQGMFGPAINRFGTIDGLRLYQARVDGEPACVLATYDNGEDCELYLVATLAEYRGRGLARRLAHRALLDARDRGLAVSSLQATELGYPVYERLGYEPICKLEMWERRRE
jgi:ribosomal protein S18 acetylase RimI-like enzyme